MQRVNGVGSFAPQGVVGGHCWAGGDARGGFRAYLTDNKSKNPTREERGKRPPWPPASAGCPGTRVPPSASAVFVLTAGSPGPTAPLSIQPPLAPCHSSQTPPPRSRQPARNPTKRPRPHGPRKLRPLRPMPRSAPHRAPTRPGASAPGRSRSACARRPAAAAPPPPSRAPQTLSLLLLPLPRTPGGAFLPPR